MKRKFKIGDEVIFIKSKVPFEADDGVMDKYVGTIGIISDILVDNEEGYDYTFKIGNHDYSVKSSEICRPTKMTRLLYGI